MQSELMSGLEIWQGCEYTRVTQSAEYALKIPQYV